MITVAINRDEFVRRFRDLADKNPSAMLMACGRELGNVLRQHFQKKDREEPNKLSPRREHFWLQVGRSVSLPVQTGTHQVSVTIADPRFAQKLFGGPIAAKEAGALTIPLSEEAYGRRASTFEQETGLKLFLLKTGTSGFERALLATKRDGGVQVEYLLTKSVMQEPTPGALPMMQEMEQAVIGRAQKVINREQGLTNANEG